MIERLKENGAEVEIEKQQPEQIANPVQGSVELFLNKEQIDELSPTRQIIVGMYRKDGNYEDVDTSEQETELLRTTRNTRNSKYTAAKATKDEAFADYLGVEPAARALREGAKQPLIDEQYAAGRARIEEKVKALKRQVADFNAELETRYTKEKASIDRRYDRIRSKEMDNLVDTFGPSFAERIASVNKRRAQEIGEKIVVAAVSVDSSKTAAKEDIAQANQEASGVDSQNASEAALEAAAAVPQDQLKTVRFDDVAVEERIVEEAGTKDEDVISPMEAASSFMDSAEERNERISKWQKEQRGSIFKRAKNKIQEVSLALGVKLSTRSVDKSPEDISRSRRKKLMGAAVGVMAVGVTAYLLKDHGHDFGLGGLFGQGSENNHANDAHSSIAQHSGHGVGGGEVMGPQVPDTSSLNPVEVAPTIPKVHPEGSGQFIQGTTEHLKHFRLESGGTIWEHAESTVRNNHPAWSEAQIQIKTHQEASNVLKQSGLTWEDARHLSVGTKF